MELIVVAVLAFALGAIFGVILFFRTWKRRKGELMTDVFKSILDDQGYEIRDGKIQPKEPNGYAVDFEGNHYQVKRDGGLEA